VHPLRWKICATLKVGFDHFHILRVIGVLKMMLLEEDHLIVVMGKMEVLALFIG
jgi:hypothetical protein